MNLKQSSQNLQNITESENEVEILKDNGSEIDTIVEKLINDEEDATGLNVKCVCTNVKREKRL